MATKPTPADIPGLNTQIERLEQEASSFQNRLNESPTALGGKGTPTSFDISNQQELDRIQNTIQGLTNNKLKAQWYPADDKSANATDTQPKQGLIGKTIDFISRPLYGVVGATKHVIGQGSGSLQKDISDNILRNKNTFGDVLKTSGMHWSVAAPLGFALDIGFDPVNWLTMGTGALVPRLGAGLVKGAAEEGLVGAARGLKVAAESGVLNKGVAVGKWVPYFKDSEAFASMTKRSLDAATKFEKLTGTTAEKLVLQRGMGVGSYRIGLGDLIERGADLIPGGKQMLSHFTYDPIDWVRQAKIKDTLQSTLGTGVDLKGAINARVAGEDITPFLKKAGEEVAQKIESMPFAPAVDLTIDMGTPSLFDKKSFELAAQKLAGSGVETHLADVAPAIVNKVDDAYTLAYNPSVGLTTDPIENAMRIANEAVGGTGVTLEEVAKIVNSGALGETGVKWFDNMMGWLKNTRKSDAKAAKVGAQVMEKYEQAMGIFRVSKVGLSPSSWVNAVVGNLLMNHMAVGDINPEFIGRLRQSFALYKGKPAGASLLDDLFMNHDVGQEIRAAFASSPTAIKGTLGDFELYNAERLLRSGRDAGIFGAETKAADIAVQVNEAMSELAALKPVAKGLTEEVLPSTVSGGTKPILDMIKKGKTLQRSDLGGGMLGNELFEQSSTRKMFEYMSKKAAEDPNNLVWKALDYTFNKASSGYETIDQSYKMATVVRSTIDGYTINQLRKMRHVIDINPEDLTQFVRDGQTRYRLPTHKALELANSMYLNYNAMPSAIRVLRNFPLVGSPFAAFMYGMAMKTGQTLAYNPAAFTKVNFAMNDFGGTKTPLEKKALSGDIYGYLNQPGMFRLPFFDENPIYVNLANVVPYYSLNLFDQSSQNYTGGTFGEGLANAIGASPLLKDPLGNVLYSYMIQPLILGEAAAPQGQFGQPLYPVDAGALQKFGYGARTLAEALVPNAAALAGLVTPESVADYVPSYRWRSLAYAKGGKNQLGISTKESIPSRVGRNVLSTLGVPVQAPVNLTFGANSTNNTNN